MFSRNNLVIFMYSDSTNINHIFGFVKCIRSATDITAQQVLSVLCGSTETEKEPTVEYLDNIWDWFADETSTNKSPDINFRLE